MDARNDFEHVGNELGKLTGEKNAAYGDSFARSGQIMAILYPNGIGTAQMRDALGVVRVLDKLFRIATRKDAFGESPWRDIAGYGIVATVHALANKDVLKHDKILLMPYNYIFTTLKYEHEVAKFQRLYSEIMRNKK